MKIFRTMADMKTERLELRLEPELRKEIDDWRKRHPVPPSRSAAIRYLLAYGVKEAPCEIMPSKL